jgi:hypothetical protein
VDGITRDPAAGNGHTPAPHPRQPEPAEPRT